MEASGFVLLLLSRFRRPLAAGALCLAMACGGGGGSSTGGDTHLTYPQTTILATAGTAIAMDTPVVPGTVTGYSVLPALPTGLVLNQNNGTISGTALEAVAQTPYSVTADLAGGTHATGSVQITVNLPSAAPSLARFTSDQTTVASGVPTVLSWSQTGATSLTIDHSVGTVTGSTWVRVYPTTTTTYHLTAQNAAGTAPVLAAAVTVTGAVTYADQFTGTPSLDAGIAAVVGDDRVFMPSTGTTATQVYKITAGTVAAGPTMANVHAYTTVQALPGGTQVLVISGTTSENSPSLVPTSSVDLITYTPGNDSWAATAMNPVTLGRTNCSSVLLPNGTILLAGGQTSNASATSQVEIYDPSADAGQGSSFVLGDLPVPMAYSASVVSGGLVYLLGGLEIVNSNTSLVPYVVIIDPATGSITQGAALPSGLGFFFAWSDLKNGTFLLAGGTSNGLDGSTNSYVFNPAGNNGLGSFTATGSLNVARILPNMVTLADGKVLVSGGMPSVVTLPLTILSSAEIFDPAGNGGAGTYASQGITVAGSECTPVLLPNGAALLPGGPAGTDGAGNTIDSNTSVIFN